MLVDTTVWVDFFRDNETKQVKILESSISNHDDIFICGVIYTEILQGIHREKEYQLTIDALKPLLYLDMNQETFALAAEIFRKLRNNGITIRKTINCMIAAVAIENKIPLLHSDKDFLPIAKYCGLLAI